MRFHVVALPHAPVVAEASTCAFTQKVRGFVRMMAPRGHDCILYAGERIDVHPAEHVVCISEDERVASLGGGDLTAASFDPTRPHWQRFNAAAIDGIRRRAQPGDFVLLFGGAAHKPIADALPDMVCVEPGIGYAGTFARYRVWESYAWMHACYGAATGGDAARADGQWFDAVIPGYFDPADFPAGDPDDYFLFIGRLIERKGAHIAAEVCQALGKRLVVAGAGTPPSYGEHIGVVGPEERGRLMAGAQAVFVPTTYLEPFGNVAVEPQFCGTPVITTDWGAFTETVEHGVAGFRCRSFAEFCDAAEAAPSLDRRLIRERAQARWSYEAVAPQYEAYFRRLATLWGRGWYERGGA